MYAMYMQKFIDFFISIIILKRVTLKKNKNKNIDLNNYSIFFGNADSALCTIKEKIKKTSDLALKTTKFAIFDSSIKHTLLMQTHSDKGVIVDKYIEPFSHEGDYLITNQKNIALSMLTADCLPIILYDQEHHACAIIHAGWRGSVQKIVQKTLRTMQLTFNTHPNNTLAFLGPNAKVCCYEVSDNFAHAFNDEALQQSLVTRNDTLFFDNVRYNMLALTALGMPEKNINLDFNDCTICCDGYGSYRKYKEESPLNISSIYLL